MDLGPDTDLDIDQVTSTLILATSPAGRFLLRADQAPVPHLQRMHRHECSSVDEAEDSSGLFIDTFSKPVLASGFAPAESGAPTPRSQHY